jgi:hypothetical protein
VFSIISVLSTSNNTGVKFWIPLRSNNYSVTITVHFLDIPLAVVAVITAFPVAFAVIFPALFTVATSLSEVTYLTLSVEFLGVRVGESLKVFPTVRVTFVFFRVIAVEGTTFALTYIIL